MVGYFLRHSHLLISLAGVLLGVALSLMSRRFGNRRRPIAYRRYRRLLLPIALTASVATTAVALLVPSGRYVVAEWKPAAVQATVWAVTTFAVLIVPSFFRVLVVLPALFVLGVSAILWKPMPIVPGLPGEITGIAVVEEEVGSPAEAVIAMLRVRRSLQTLEPEILVLPTAALAAAGGTTTPVERGIDIAVELFTPPFALWWLPPRGTPLRVQIGDVTLLRYPDGGLQARVLSLLEEHGVARRRRYTVRYPSDTSRFIQSGVLFVEMVSDPLSFRAVPTDDW